ncbi:Meiotically up-regulated gene 113 [uncultured Caudovirales phage]|uniref:Meiotically up-regulated gene 113 n=1 Tax=uncultured Caudovirales phage TaxID=2100421 RepID=A0A6J7WXW5_9CAUD|nr:Meiotically up-regulated gene 113 [uncultured Caudovirales phage]
MEQNGEIALIEDGTDGDSSANEAALPDHSMATDRATSIGTSPYTKGGYWLSKRRDGRSDNWMIARWQPKNRSVIYKSTRTTDFEVAKDALDRVASLQSAEHHPVPSRSATKVYFIISEFGPIKIGATGDIDARLSTLRTMSPCGLTLAAVAEGGCRIERDYHIRFAEHRLHGEWFAPHPDILAEIARLGAKP